MMHLASIDPRLNLIRRRNSLLRDGTMKGLDAARERRHDDDPAAFHKYLHADPTSCPVCIIRKARALRGLAESEEQLVDTPILTKMREAITQMKAVNDAKEAADGGG